MREFPILYWPQKATGDADYQLSRKVINNLTGQMPEVILEDLDINAIFQEKEDAVI